MISPMRCADSSMRCMAAMVLSAAALPLCAAVRAASTICLAWSMRSALWPWVTEELADGGGHLLQARHLLFGA